MPKGKTDNFTPSVSHSLDLLEDESLLQQSIHAGQFIVRHELKLAERLESFPGNYHLLAVLLDVGTCQVTRFAGEECNRQQQRGDIWLRPAGLSELWRRECSDEKMLFIFDPEFLRRTALESDFLNPNKVELKPLRQAYDPTLLNLSLSFLHEMHANGVGRRFYSECLANQFAIHLLRHYCTFEPVFRTYDGGLSHSALVRAIDYIHEHLDDKLSVDAIASHLNLSVYYFCTLFTQSMGISPYQYVLQQRVERVKYLLKTSPLPLSAIAVSCGFNDQTQMSKHFRKLTGMTPKAYRKGD
jgi:AraC family transcriptional regulator